MQKGTEKYKINHYITQLPRVMTIEMLIEILKNEHKISRDQFYRDRNLTLKDKGSIPSHRLDVYAALFDVSADDLKNYTVKTIKPLSERQPSEMMKKIMKRTGLKK